MSSTLVTTSDARQQELAAAGQETNAAVKSKLFNWNTFMCFMQLYLSKTCIAISGHWFDQKQDCTSQLIYSSVVFGSHFKDYL